jgi:choline-sulfatase
MGASLSAIGLGSLMSCTEKNAIPEKPNILFIFADDQCYETIRALGCNEVITPNLDRLVKRGVTFTHAYNQGAWHGAVCVASRAMLNTGRFLWHTQKAEEIYKDDPQAIPFWSELLYAAGYDTYFSGKWHVKKDANSVFQTARHIRPGMPNQTPKGYDRPKKDEPNPWKPWDKSYEGYWKGGKHWSEVLGDDSVEYLSTASKQENPFFMYLAFNAPHDPRQSPKEYVEKYPLENIGIPENYLPEYPYKESIGCGESLRDERLAPFPRTEYAVKVNRQEYYAIITHMDNEIGRILDTLKETGKEDNSIIFFTADHGLAVGHHGLMGKQNMFEHSLRPPLIVAGPGIPQNTKIDAPVYLQDIMPTTLQLANIEKPDYVQFKSLLPLITRKTQKSYNAIYGAYRDLQRTVIQGNHKLILYPQIQKILLFDLENDPREMENLVDLPENTDLIKRLFATLLILQEETDDDLDLKTIYPDLV